MCKDRTRAERIKIFLMAVWAQMHPKKLTKTFMMILNKSDLKPSPWFIQNYTAL